MKFADAFIIRKFLAAKSCHNKEANSNTFKYDCSKRKKPTNQIQDDIPCRHVSLSTCKKVFQHHSFQQIPHKLTKYQYIQS